MIDDYQDDDFEWTGVKAAENLRNHEVSFEEAKKVFDDPFAYEFEDDREHYGEQRFITIGWSGRLLLTVVSTPRGTRTHIISAWPGERQEGRKYHEANRR